MQFFSIQVLALLATAVVAMPSSPEARALEQLEQRADCGQVLPACNGGTVSGQTDCRCKGQNAPCDLWTCPGGAPNVMVCGQSSTGCVWI